VPRIRVYAFVSNPSVRQRPNSRSAVEKMLPMIGVFALYDGPTSDGFWGPEVAYLNPRGCRGWAGMRYTVLAEGSGQVAFRGWV
jgi:hypothetical protein